MRLAAELLAVAPQSAPVSVSLSGWCRDGDALLTEPEFLAFCAAFSQGFVPWPLVLDLDSPFARFVFLSGLSRLDVVESGGSIRLASTEAAVIDRINSLDSAISHSVLMRFRVKRCDLRDRLTSLARSSI